MALKRAAPLFLLCIQTASCSAHQDNETAKQSYWQKQIEESQQTLNQQVLTESERGSALSNLARAYSGIGQKNKAFSLWRDMLDNNEIDSLSKARAQYRLALAHEMEKRWKEAIDGYQRFAHLYYALSEKKRDNFDQASENGATILFHVGEIYEYKLSSTNMAELAYEHAVRVAETGDSLNRTDLVEHLGDFYFRHGKYLPAIQEYETVSGYFQENEQTLASPGTRPEYKIIRCLLLSNRQEAAEKRYNEFMAKWGDTEYQLDRRYVRKVKILMQNSRGGGRLP